MKILVTGGTVFVSKYIAEYFVNAGHNVYVLNRNSRPQVKGVNLINADRHNPGGVLKSYNFDLVVDTGYNKQDICDILDGLGKFKNYVFISSSAVYPETLLQPFKEDMPIGANSVWGAYGINKIQAENELLKKVGNAYILRPPYLYGEYNNIYREAFVFDCAESNRKFYLPKDGSMKLQFFYIGDLCRLIEKIVKAQPQEHIINVGCESVSVRQWVELCYKAVGKSVEFVLVSGEIEQRKYFPFYDYEYCLDINRQNELLEEITPLADGLRLSYWWYKKHKDELTKKPYIEFIDSNLK